MLVEKRPNLMLTPEFRLIAACARVVPEFLEAEQFAEIASICAGQLDWQHFLYLVRINGVQALVYETLIRLDTNAVPDEVATLLKAWRKSVVMNSLQQSGELLSILSKFSCHGIDLVPLKGVMLSQWLYGSIGVRCSSDLDILVRIEDLDKACQLLEEDGYYCSIHGFELTTKQKKHIKENLYHLEFYNKEKCIAVEIHWRLGSLWTPEHMTHVWRNIDIISWQGSEVMCLNNNLQLLFLCDHGSRHRFVRLKWLSDTAKAFTLLPNREWQHLLALADILDLRSTLAHSLLLVNWVYSVPLSKEVVSFINQEKSAIKLARKIFRLLHLGSFAGVSSGRRLGGLFCSWQVLRLRTSLSILRTLKPSLIAAGDFQDYPLPDSLFCLYYFLRPYSWLHRYMR